VIREAAPSAAKVPPSPGVLGERVAVGERFSVGIVTAKFMLGA
jgi:hypothetical protein